MRGFVGFIGFICISVAISLSIYLSNHLSLCLFTCIIIVKIRRVYSDRVRTSSASFAAKQYSVRVRRSLPSPRDVSSASPSAVRGKEENKLRQEATEVEFPLVDCPA